MIALEENEYISVLYRFIDFIFFSFSFDIFAHFFLIIFYIISTFSWTFKILCKCF